MKISWCFQGVEWNDWVFYFLFQSVFLSFLVAVPYEKPINTAVDVLERVDRVHICKGELDCVVSIHTI